MKTPFLLLLFFLHFGVHAQFQQRNGQFQYLRIFEETDDFGKEYLDELEQTLNKINNDTLRFRIINDLGYHYHTRNLQRALEVIEEGLEETRAVENKLWEGRMQVSQGAILLRMEDLDYAELVLRSALEKIPEAETWLLLTNLGYVYERRGDLGEAFEFASRTLRLGEKYQDKKAIAMAYSDMSNLFWKQKKFDQGLYYGLKSIRIFEERGLKDLDYDFTLHVVGNNLMELGRYRDALPYFNRSIEIGTQYGFYNNLSDSYIALTDLYAQMGKYEESEEAGLKALRYAELLENDFMVIRSLLSLGKLENLTGDFSNAVSYLERSINLAEDDFGDKYYLGLIYQELSKAYDGQSRLTESYNAFKQFHELTQSVFNAETDQRIALLQTQMEVNQKENTISLQEARLKQQKILQVFILTLAGAMVLFLFFLIRVFLRNKKYSFQLEKQNTEKEFLLKEIHHRVKNNLETISSLLSLQTAKIENTALQEIMVESQNRVHSMGMIHQKLYQGENLSAIEMKDYFLNLGEHIIDSFNAADRIKLACPMEPMYLNVDRAIPIGLIVNEILTNSLKYAFPNDMGGEINISLRDSNSHLLLSVHDNGVGMGESTKGTGFGSQLIDLLTRQLDGKMSLNTQKGTAIHFEFQIHTAA